MKKTVSVGIDLGTTNTLVCTMRRGKMKCLKFRDNGEDIILPSVVGVIGGTIYVGASAENMEITDPYNVVRSAKSYMNDTNKSWNLDGKNYSPVDISAEILKEVHRVVVDNAIKEDRSLTPEDIEVEAVITVPAYFKNLETNLTKKAGEKAGFVVKRIITEPMAAALNYINDNDLKTGKRLLVVDIGGGTFDLSLLDYDENIGEYKTVDLGGDRHLGGDDFDIRVTEKLKEYVLGDLGIDLSSAAKAGIEESIWRRMCARLRNEAESAKMYLSGHDEAQIVIPDFCGNMSFETTLLRSEFDEICRDLYDRIETKIRTFLKRNNIALDDIWRVVLVGGSCSIPYIQQLAETLFTDNKIYYDRDMESPIAMGALLVCSNYINVPPDILSHSLGVQVQGGVFEPILLRSQQYPCSASKLFTTTTDDQSSVCVNIYETIDEDEDSSVIKNCSPYGYFELTNIQKAKRGVPQIEVTFSFNESRILTVSAVDKNSGSSAQISLREAMLSDMPTGSSQPALIYLMIDTSGSMGMNRKLDLAKDASHRLVNEMIDFSCGTKMALGEFESSARHICSLTDDKAMLNNSISGLTDKGCTDFAGAISLAVRELICHGDKPRYIISLTDGDPDSKSAAERSAKEAEKQGIKLINIGVGLDRKTKSWLSEVSSKREDGSRYIYLINDMNGLSDVFKTIAGELALYKS